MIWGNQSIDGQGKVLNDLGIWKRHILYNYKLEVIAWTYLSFLLLSGNYMPVVDTEESEYGYEDYAYLPGPDYDLTVDVYATGRCKEGFHEFLH